MNTIPSDEDFARAKKLARERSRNLDMVEESLLRHFKDTCPLHRFDLMSQGVGAFKAFVFFKEDKDIQTCKDNGIADALIDLVYAELERAGRGKRGDITVAFEFDSDENVKANFEGSYFYRLL